MDVRLTWTDSDEAGDYVEPNVLSPRDLVSRPDNMDEAVLRTSWEIIKGPRFKVSSERLEKSGGSTP